MESCRLQFILSTDAASACHRIFSAMVMSPSQQTLVRTVTTQVRPRTPHLTPIKLQAGILPFTVYVSGVKIP